MAVADRRCLRFPEGGHGDPDDRGIVRAERAGQVSPGGTDVASGSAATFGDERASWKIHIALRHPPVGGDRRIGAVAPARLVALHRARR